MGFARFVGLRFLRPKRGELLLSIITVIGITAVAVGVATLIVVLGVMTGFQEDMMNKILGAHSHLLVESKKKVIHDWAPVLAAVQRVDGVAAAAPYVHGELMATSTDHAAGVIVRGIDPDLAPSVTNIGRSVERGSLQLLKREQEVLEPLGENKRPEKLPGIILGKELAAEVRVFIGEKLYLVNPIGDIGPLGIMPKTQAFVVVGIFKSGLYEFDAKYALIDLHDAQKFFGLGDGISGIEVKLKDMWQIERVGRDIRAQLAPPLFAKDWQELNRNLFSAIKVEKLVMFLMLCIIIFVAALNIFSNLYMVVMDKRKSIAMLRAMGASSRRIRQIVLAQGMTIGILGSAIGVALGLGLCLLQMRYGLVKLDPYVYYIDKLPITLKAFDLAAVIVASLGLCLGATWMPARMAARLDAVEVLRYE